MESVYEQMFLLKYHSGFSIFETYNFPVGLRDWFSEQLKKQLEREEEALKNPKK